MIDYQNIVNQDEVVNYIYEVHSGLSNLIFDAHDFLDKQGNTVHFVDFGYYWKTLFELDQMIKKLSKRINLIENLIMIFFDRAKAIDEYYPSDEDAREFWDNNYDNEKNDESDETPDERFEKWQNSHAFYDWLNDESQFYWEDLKSENKDIFDNLPIDDWYIQSSQGGIYPGKIEKYFNEINKVLKELYKEWEYDIIHYLIDNFGILSKSDFKSIKHWRYNIITQLFD